MRIIIFFSLSFFKECRSFNTLTKNGRFEEEVEEEMEEEVEEVEEEERKNRKRRRKRKRKWV